MYSWIWRHLPFGWPGKLISSLALVAAGAALLWYVVFPWAEPLLPFDDVQVTQQDVPADPAPPGVTGGSAGPRPSAQPSLGDFDVPYATHSNNPSPTAGR